MKIIGLVALAAGATLWGKNQPVPKATVTVCMESDAHLVSGALPVASAMFASIGVRIDWRQQGCPNGAGAIVVSLSFRRPDQKAETFAFAQPYDGHIVVFPDALRQFDVSQRPWVLAHVLVHEITHVLQGISRHSASGIMKARWDADDFVEMRHDTLRFTQEDVDLIFLGLKMRQAHPITGVPQLEVVASQVMK